MDGQVLSVVLLDFKNRKKNLNYCLCRLLEEFFPCFSSAFLALWCGGQRHGIQGFANRIWDGI